MSSKPPSENDPDDPQLAKTLKTIASSGLRPERLEIIEEIVFHNLFINSILIGMAVISVVAVMHLQKNVEWWSFSALTVACGLIGFEDLLSWIGWQLDLERSMKLSPLTGYWIQARKQNGVIKAIIGSMNYPERHLWTVSVYYISKEAKFSEEKIIDVKIYMNSAQPIPSAIETSDSLFLVKPPARISMLLLDYWNSKKYH